MLKIVADTDIPFLKGVLEPFASVVYRKASQITNSLVVDADAIITRTRTLCNAQLLNNTKVRLIASATIGHDHIDKEYCKAAAIKWVNAPGCNSGSVQQYLASVLAVIIKKTGKLPAEITLGVIGAGNVGKKVINLANNIGIKALVNDPPRSRIEGPDGFCSLDELLTNSDIITLHVPLNKDGEDKTQHLADDFFFQKAKTGAWFINTSRGEVASPESLKNALKTKKISGAVIDVWENEPNIDLELLQLTSIATPHIAGYSADGKANGTTMIIREISQFFGLGIDTWNPKEIPHPPIPVFEVSEGVNSPIDVFCELSLAVYPILEDHERLVKNPSKFENFRSNYHIRREPPAIGVITKALSGDVVDLIRKLDYRIV